jgi:hypothetical protein
MSNINHAKQLVAEVLKRKRCQLYPECACHELVIRWQQLPADEWPLEFEALAWAETSIFLALSCLERHCPDRQVRIYATLQLLNSYWNRQKRGEELSEEWVRRRRLEQEQ